MKNIVRIKLLSIEKNPNAGSTVTYVHGLKEVIFTIDCKKIPKAIKAPPFYITQTYSESLNKVNRISGVINGPFTYKQLKKWCKELNGLTINVKQDINRIHHLPEPDYLFEYEKTYLRCGHCKNLIEVEDIESDNMFDMVIQLCPKCDHIDTFPEYVYEDIKDALKKLTKRQLKNLQ
jgi:hypothetical protein